MTGNDFLLLAAELSQGASESYWRSATSRAYYAAFHVAREALESNQIPVPESAPGHERVYRCLNNAGEDELAKAGAKLNTLRSARNKADYEIGPRRFPKGQAAVDLGIARKVIGKVEASSLLGDSPEVTKQAILGYLRRTGQLLG